MLPSILTASTKTDRARPEFLQIYSDIKLQLRTLLTRTTGPDRERIIATKNVNSNEVLLKRQNEVKK